MRANHVTARTTVPRPVGGISRVLAVVLLALQAMLWIGGPIADGILEGSSARMQTHVEEQGGNKCPRIHSHLDCLICRTLGQGALTTTGESLLPRDERAGVAFCETSAVSVARARFGALGSRAPPRV